MNKLTFETKPISADLYPWQAPLKVSIHNQTTGEEVALRHSGRGFFLSIESVDDLACYIDVPGGIDDSTFSRVCKYLENPVGLKNPFAIANDLVEFLPETATVDFS
jgi:hypothetical protein